MWFSKAEAQFRRTRITAETNMYDYVLMKLPEDVVMSVWALVSAIEADLVKQEGSYTFMKEALMGSYGKTKWQMAYALLDRRPPMMMAEMLGLRFETSAPDSLLLALYLRRLPASIRDHLAVANHETATAIATHADILWDARNAVSVSQIRSLPCHSAPLRLGTAALRTAAPSLLTAAPDHPVAAATMAAAAAPHLDARTAEPPAPEARSATTTRGPAPRP
jgi:hypothetical protein